MKYLVLDTNVFLHYQDIETIDWQHLIGTEVTLCIVPCVLSELDKHKRNSNNKVSARAKSTLKRLRDYSSDISSHPKGISIDFIYTNPKDKTFIDHSLDKAEFDDKLLASALELAQKNGSGIILVTADYGPEMRAKSVGLDSLLMPEKYLLKQDVDPQEKELIETKKALQKLTSALPKLNLGLTDGSKFLKVEKNASPPPFDAFIKERIETLKREVQKLNCAEYYTEVHQRQMAAMFQPTATHKECEAYNVAVDDYYSRYEAYLLELYEYQLTLLNSFEFVLTIENSGSIPAEDIDIELIFPQGLTVYDYENPPEQPTEPLRPNKPWWLRRGFGMMGRLSEIMDNNNPLSVDVSKIRLDAPEILENNGGYVVSYHIKSLKHNLSRELDPLLVIVNNTDKNGFSVRYIIHTGNIPIPKEGVININVTSQQ
ncbi:hypothetical protein D770_24720 [Flammeovirgaceae bacterium 311]|nr:hypothetical protein D770_24720 [Flammeovirgaceae bacterium 311]